MAIYDEIRAQLQELIELVEQDAQCTSAVAHGAIVADLGTAQAHHSVQLVSSNSSVISGLSEPSQPQRKNQPAQPQALSYNQ